jgi:hypothetical protein
LGRTPRDKPEGQRAAVDVELSEDRFNAALLTAYNWTIAVEPPMGGSAKAFDLYLANCTDFAVEVAKAAEFPISVTRIPAFNSSGFGLAATPNKLYEAIQETGYDYDPSIGEAPEVAPTVRDILQAQLEALLDSIK